MRGSGLSSQAASRGGDLFCSGSIPPADGGSPPAPPVSRVLPPSLPAAELGRPTLGSATLLPLADAVVAGSPACMQP